MKFGMGLGWVQRRFAKPFEKGSIPSHASNYHPWTPKVRKAAYGMQWSFGTWLAVKLLSGRGPLRSAVQYQAIHYARQAPGEKMRRASPRFSTPSTKLELDRYQKLVECSAKLDKLQEQNIKLSRELSVQKRKQSWVEGDLKCPICGSFPHLFSED